MKTILFKPFEYCSEKKLLLAGVGITLIGSLLGFWFNARFDGVLDLHFVQDTMFFTAFFDNVINIFSLCFVLFILAKYFNKKTRFIDILMAALISRGPMYLLSVFNSGNFLSQKAEALLQYATPEKIGQIPPMDSLWFILVFSVFSILFLIWYMALLYNGFKIACHAKGTKAVVLFCVAILVAEVLSKFLVYHLNTLYP